MRLKSYVMAGLFALALVGSLPTDGFAQTAGQWSGEEGVGAKPAAQKFTFILFWRENNAATQEMAGILKSAAAQRSDRAESMMVNVTDPANQSLVQRYGVSRAPLPLVLCVAPNGAVTGAFQKRLTEQDVEGALVSPSMTECLKALQADKIVVVHVKADANEPLPPGTTDFITDPMYQTRTAVVSLAAYDPAESRFLNDMQINSAAVNASMVTVLAPPGSLVGKFPATVSKEQIAAALHAAGKCCNDPKCKHNK